MIGPGIGVDISFAPNMPIRGDCDLLFSDLQGKPAVRCISGAPRRINEPDRTEPSLAAPSRRAEIRGDAAEIPVIPEGAGPVNPVLLLLIFLLAVLRQLVDAPG
jgi:hypothetical protein